MNDQPHGRPPEPTADLPAPASPAPDQTTDLPARPADTARRGDTSVAPDRRPAPTDTGAYEPAPGTASTFDPSRTPPLTPSAAAGGDDPSRTGLHTSSAEPEPAAPAVPGYEILGELGRGGMGVVYKARQTALDRVVALKMILAGPHASRSVVARFLAEARAVARFQHPNIVQIHEVGEFGGMPYFSLEFVDGGTLAARIAREPQPPGYAAAVAEQLARAMQYAHDRGIIHRDLKPANVLLARDGTPKVTDFGLAKRLEGDSGQTQAGQVLGTPSHMAPEQARGEVESVGRPADVYALGAILYDLLTGRPPFAGSSVLDTLELVRTRDPVPPRQLIPKVPKDLETICLKCLQKEPAKRYASAGDLADDLRRFLDGRPIVARPVGPAERTWRWAKRNPWVAGLGAAAAVLLLATAVIGVTFAVVFDRQRREAERLAGEKSDALDLAQANLNTAVTERDLKEKARAAEEAAKKKAEEERDAKEKARAAEAEARVVAVEQRNNALMTIRRVVRDVDDLMRNKASLAPTRVKIITAMLEDLDKVRDQFVKNPVENRTEGIGLSRLGDVYARSGRVEDAADWLRKAHRVFQILADESPDDPAALFNIAGISNQLADVEWRLGNGPRARELYAAGLAARRKRLPILEEHVRQKKLDPNLVTLARYDIADSYGLVAFADLRLGNADDAVPNYLASDREFAAHPRAGTLDIRLRRAEIQGRLGDARLRQGDPREAERHYRAALAERETLLRLTPKPPEAVAAVKGAVGLSRVALGDFLLAARGDPAGAAAEYATAMELFAAGLAPDPDNLTYRQRVAAAHYRLGVVAERQAGGAVAGVPVLAGRSAGHLAECLRVRAELARIDPKDATAKVEWMLALARSGKAADAERLGEELLGQAGKDPQVLFQVACGFALASAVVADPAAAARDRDRAFRVLGDLITAGWKDRAALELEPDLEPIRGESRFVTLLTRIQRPPMP